MISKKLKRTKRNPPTKDQPQASDQQNEEEITDFEGLRDQLNPTSTLLSDPFELASIKNMMGRPLIAVKNANSYLIGGTT